MSGNLATFMNERMGNVHLKTRCGRLSPWRKQKTTQNMEDKADKKIEETIWELDNQADREELSELKRLIKEKPNVFILNNLILSIQLFSHYDKEIKKARQEVMIRERELNEKLLPEKMAMLPDVLREHFTGRVRFTSFCKSDKDEQTVEPLRPIQIYLVYENVFVTELDESRHYSNPTELAIDYTFVIKEIKENEHKGYVRLEKLQQPSLKGTGSDNTDLSSIAENESEIYSEDDFVCESVNGKKQNGHVVTNTSLSMSHLLDEELYYNRQNSTQNLQYNGHATSSTELNSKTVGVVNGKTRISRLHQSLYNRQTSAINPSSASSSSSGYTTNYGLDSDSDSSRLNGGRIRNLRRAGGSYSDLSEIPNLCFKLVTYMYNGRIYNHRREQKPLTSQQRRIREAKLAHNYNVIYVNGYRFAKYFFEVFKDQLAEKMNFDEQVIKNAKKSDAVIRLEKIDYLTSKNFISIEQYELIPCFSSPWPKWARKWLERPRSIWPTFEDQRKIDKFGCYLIPEALRPISIEEEKKNPLWKLNWSMCFPVAERYLETCLTSAQMTVYSIALMLHKTFIRTMGTTFGLNTSHIRNIIFWMVEEEPNWSSHEMGQFIIKLLELLHSHIQQRKMLDYFVADRNLFENVHWEDLLHSQKQLKRILENPVMFVFHAMEKIYYERDDYPRLDYRELLRLLTINEMLLINPNIPTKSTENTDENANSEYPKRDPVKKFWSDAKQTNQHYMQMRRRGMNTLINPKHILDSVIDIQEKCEPLTNARLEKLLIFFSEHFLRMAKCCHKQGAAQQKDLYLDQTRLLALLLHEHAAGLSKDILSRVKDLRNNVIRTPPVTNTDETAPETPKRNITDAPIYARKLKDRFGSGQTAVPEENEAGPSNTDTSVPKTRLYQKTTTKVESKDTESLSTVSSENTPF